MDIFVSLPAQTLELYHGPGLLGRYRISSAVRGAGEERGSFMTPRGRHLVRAKIGTGCPENTVFVGRRPTEELWTPELATEFPERDWILTRILWLSGCEPGCNRLGQVDTMRRYIYLHGTPDTVKLGVPGSRGCLRMSNRDIIELFDRTPAYIPVNIGDFLITAGQRRDNELEVQAMDNSGAPIARCLANDAGLITALEVSEVWRSRGVAKQLLRSLIALAAASGMERLGVDAPSYLEAMWLRLGFQAGAKSAGPALVLTLKTVPA